MIHEIASLLAITWLPELDDATAAKYPRPGGPPHVTDRQRMSAVDVRDVHTIPSGLVITRLPVPDAATAAKI
jgi:hypothetical protein